MWADDEEEHWVGVSAGEMCWAIPGEKLHCWQSISLKITVIFHVTAVELPTYISSTTLMLQVSEMCEVSGLKQILSSKLPYGLMHSIEQKHTHIFRVEFSPLLDWADNFVGYQKSQRRRQGGILAANLACFCCSTICSSQILTNQKPCWTIGLCKDVYDSYFHLVNRERQNTWSISLLTLFLNAKHMTFNVSHLCLSFSTLITALDTPS